MMILKIIDKIHYVEDETLLCKVSGGADSPTDAFNAFIRNLASLDIKLGKATGNQPLILAGNVLLASVPVS